MDRGESSRNAAYRETWEETGVIVKVTHRLFTGNNNPIKVFAGQRVGGRLRFQKKECLDVRWRNPARIRPEDLAFGGDRKEQLSIGHQTVVVEGDLDAVGVLQW